jgi:hypothetical protein
MTTANRIFMTALFAKRKKALLILACLV